MFGGGDDDEDFFSNSKSSKLASLFGPGKSLDDGNTSLTYTAPKQPKKTQATDDQKLSTQRTVSSSKFSVIVAKPVTTYKLEEGSHKPQGKLGAAVLGNAESRAFQVILYKGKDSIIASARINPQFQYIVQVNNYATFYDDHQQNWSVMFETANDGVEFAKQVSLARVLVNNSESGQEMLIQDLLVLEGAHVNSGDTLEILYSARSFQSSTAGNEVDSNFKNSKGLKIKLKAGEWEESLIGMTKGSKRFIFLPKNSLGFWKSKVPSGSSLVLEVEVVRVKVGRGSNESTPRKMSTRDSGGESTLESSTEETSIKARGASISEALTSSPKTNKASIISRMAKMGQATLPLKGAVTCNPSDSEESEEESNHSKSSTSPIPKQVPKPRNLKNRITTPSHPTNNVDPPASSHPVNTSVYPQVNMYPGVTTMALQGIQAPGQLTSVQYTGLDGQMLPVMPHHIISTPQVFPTSVVTTPSVPSPDSHLAVYLSETRTQNTELRMGVTRVSEKVDQVISKLDNMQLQQTAISGQSTRFGALDPSVLLTSIQKLVNDNERLQADVAEKQTKLEQQSEKIYELMTFNQKFMEKSTSMMEQRQDTSSLQSTIFNLQQEKANLLAELKESSSKITLLEAQLNASSELTEKVKSLSSCLQSQQTILDEKKLAIQKLEDALMESFQTRKSLEESLEKLQVNISELESKKGNAEHQLNETLQQLTELSANSEKHKEELKKEYETELEVLRMKLTTERNSSSEDDNRLAETEIELLKSKLNEELSGKYEPLIKKLKHENSLLKKQLQDLDSEISTMKTGNTRAAVAEEVKKVMNAVYRTLQSKFQVEESYEGSKIRELLVATIRNVTLDLLEVEKANPEQQPQSRLPAKLSKTDSSKAASESVANEQLRPIAAEQSHSSSVSTVKNTTENVEKLVEPQKYNLKEGQENIEKINKNKEQQAKETHDDETQAVKGTDDVQLVEEIANDEVQFLEETAKDNERPLKELSRNKVEPLKELGKVEGQDIEEKTQNVTQAEQKKVEPSENIIRNISPDRSWRPQPPPPPLFDDEDDDDDWLS